MLLSQTQRLRALQLLNRYLALGATAVNLSLIVGIYPYILKLLPGQAEDSRHILISIWSSIIGFDISCREQLVREKSQTYFIQVVPRHVTSRHITSHLGSSHILFILQFLGSKDATHVHLCMAAFVLAEICNGYREGQQTCLEMGLHRVCTSAISSIISQAREGSSADEQRQYSSLKVWICLCLGKLCEDFLWAKYLCITEAGHTQLYPLLVDPNPNVRAAAVSG